MRNRRCGWNVLLVRWRSRNSSSGFEVLGFKRSKVIARLDYFAGGSSESTRKVAAGSGVSSVTIKWRKNRRNEGRYRDG